MRTRVFFAAFCMAVAASAQSALDLNVVVNAKSGPPIRPPAIEPEPGKQVRLIGRSRPLFTSTAASTPARLRRDS